MNIIWTRFATAARMNEDGSWKMYKAYNLGDSLDMNGPNL